MRPENTFHVDLITLIFRAKHEKAGARTIKMILRRDFNLTINLKKIRRVMKKFGLVTKIRVKNKYASMKIGIEHQAAPNLLEQNFEADSPDKIYSADITYLHYGVGSIAYLFAVKDLHTKEIVHSNLSPKINMDLVMTGLETFYQRLGPSTLKDLVVHTDQGCHFTAKEYRQLLTRFGIKQSMSRKGNCYDNAPIESFFGHLKDEVNLFGVTAYVDIANKIRTYIDYYNNERPQWGLKQKTPTECRGYQFGALF